MAIIKIAVICHFSNPQIRRYLKLYNGKYYSYKDFGLWNVNIINGLKNCDAIEVHVIAPHPGMKEQIQEFECDNVFYHFYRAYPLYPIGNILSKLGYYKFTKYSCNRKLVKKILHNIKPELVNLIGAENPYYSITALDVEGIPIIIHLQTVYANPDRIKKTGNVDSFRWEVELKLFKKTRYMACTGRMYYDLVKKYNPSAIVFPRRWPVSNFPMIPEVPKRYDFAFFARLLNKNKGFDSAIEAIAIAVKKHPNMRVLAVGSWDGDRNYFENKIVELGINDNLDIHPSFPDYLDMLRYVKQARFALLPIKMDVLSGTILEALNMGMPVVTCRTSGTPSLNIKRNTALISDIEDNEALAENMIRLYENEDLAETLRNNGLLYIREKEEENIHNAEIMVKQIQAVLEHFHNGTPIPQDLLYNIDVNIDYRK